MVVELSPGRVVGGYLRFSACLVALCCALELVSWAFQVFLASARISLRCSLHLTPLCGRIPGLR